MSTEKANSGKNGVIRQGTSEGAEMKHGVDHT